MINLLIIYRKKEEKIKDTKELIRSRKSKKDRQYNGQTKNEQKDKQGSTIHYTEN